MGCLKTCIASKERELANCVDILKNGGSLVDVTDSKNQLAELYI